MYIFKYNQFNLGDKTKLNKKINDQIEGKN